MFLELELGALLAVQSATLLVAARRRGGQRAELPTATPGAPSLPLANLEILKRIAGEWSSIGFRHAAHPDVREALDTVGLAVRRADGTVDEGRQ